MKKWLVDESVYTVYEYIAKLDYDLEFAEDRVKLVNQILKDDCWLINYISSKGFIDKQVKKKTSFLSEDDVFCKALGRIAEYVDFAKYNNQIDKTNKKIGQQPIITAKKQQRNLKKEKLFEDLSMVNENEIVKTKTKIRNKKDNFKVQTKQTIDDIDRKQFIEIDEVCKLIEYLHKKLGYGLLPEKRNSIQNKIIEQYGKKQLFQIKKLHGQLKSEVLFMKERLRGTIYFKRLSGDSTEYNFDNDTGYVKENGDYHLVSENKLEFKNPKHIFALIDNYYELKQSYEHLPNSDMWVILNDLDDLIDKSHLNLDEKQLIQMKIDGYTNKEIAQSLSPELDEYTTMKVSRMYKNEIPKKLSDTYLDLYDEWLYTYKAKGKYKSCTQCGEIKIASIRYYGKNSGTKDKLQSVCKLCDNLRKK